MRLRILALCALLILAYSVAAQTPPAPKPPVGVPADATFFNGKWYAVVFAQVRWKNAQERCTRAGGRLAIVPDAPTHTFLQRLADGKSLWLGATDEKQEGVWKWVDDSAVKFKAFGKGEPANYDANENYLMIHRGTWADVRDHNKWVIGYICEWGK